MNTIIDISRPLHNGMPVWPGDEPFAASWSGRIADGDTCNVGRMTLSLHCGTHIDAPFHIDDDGRRISQSDVESPDTLEPFVGSAQVISVVGVPTVTVDHLQSRVEPGVRRLILRTDSFPIGSFNRSYTWLGTGAAALLAELGVVLVGIDTPSVDAFDSEHLETHRILAGAGIFIVEGLDLTRAPDGIYELVVLPLRLAGMDASPTRAILRR
ncbi:MAG: arylformamidase [Candidatus Zixiibacteriota bacterium]